MFLGKSYTALRANVLLKRCRLRFGRRREHHPPVLLQVDDQQLLRGKSATALFAGEIGVNFGVRDKLLHPTKAFAAVFADVRFGAVVQLAVLLQRSLLKELFSADCAGVGGMAVSSPVVNLNKLANKFY
jgi:hypothetical protein